MLKIKDNKNYERFCEALRVTDQNSDVQECSLRHRVCNSHNVLLSITLLILMCYVALSLSYDQHKGAT